MGYVAELQQLDDPGPVPAVAAPWAPAESVRPLAAPTVFPEEPEPLFETEPAPIVSHARPVEPGRKGRLAVICGGVLAIVAGLSVGYAALGGSGAKVAARAPGVAATTAPAGGTLGLEPAVPGADPILGATTDPAPVVTTTPVVVRTTAPGGADPVPVQTPDAPAPADPPRSAEPVATAEPTDAAPITQPALPALPLPAVATFTYEAQEVEEGWTGYTGTVRVSNPGERRADWTVTLTVPGGNPVTASGATVSQDAEAVTFTGEPIAAGESVSFTFTVDGTLAELPGGCRVDGNACS